MVYSSSRARALPEEIVATVATTNVHCLYEDSKLRREEEESEEGRDLATYSLSVIGRCLRAAGGITSIRMRGTCDQKMVR